MAMEQEGAAEIERKPSAKEPEWMREYLTYHNSLVTTECEGPRRSAGHDERGQRRD
jgi:hypothetical protein